MAFLRHLLSVFGERACSHLFFFCRYEHLQQICSPSVLPLNQTSSACYQGGMIAIYCIIFTSLPFLSPPSPYQLAIYFLTARSNCEGNPSVITQQICSGEQQHQKCISHAIVVTFFKKKKRTFPPENIIFLMYLLILQN